MYNILPKKKCDSDSPPEQTEQCSSIQTGKERTKKWLSLLSVAPQRKALSYNVLWSTTFTCKKKKEINTCTCGVRVDWKLNNIKYIIMQ